MTSLNADFHQHIAVHRLLCRLQTGVEPLIARISVALNGCNKKFGLRTFAILNARDRGTLKSYVFKVVVEDDEREDGRKAYQAYGPEIEEAVTWGNTREEAMQRINELLKCARANKT